MYSEKVYVQWKSICTVKKYMYSEKVYVQGKKRSYKNLKFLDKVHNLKS